MIGLTSASGRMQPFKRPDRNSTPGGLLPTHSGTQVRCLLGATKMRIADHLYETKIYTLLIFM